jgi:NADPH:quinone reductase-like Zn-dependent oxidoreductase
MMEDASMKAVVMEDYGDPDVLHLADIPDPVAGPGEVVVDIHAASVNPADWKVRAGLNRGTWSQDGPHVLGRDFSGVVREVGHDVRAFSPGDAVYGVTTQANEGTYAEAIAIEAEIVAAKPASLTHAETAALGLAALTALVALEDTARLQPGEVILVQGGAGGVGGVAVQYARHVGATVLATARSRNHAYLRGLGADDVIDYTQVDFTEVVPACDVVLDTVGGEVLPRNLPVLKTGGRLIHVAPGPEGFVPTRDDVTVIRPTVPRDRPHLERIVDLVEQGAVRPPQITTMALSEAVEAHRLIQEGHVRGKLVFVVR